MENLKFRVVQRLLCVSIYLGNLLFSSNFVQILLRELDTSFLVCRFLQIFLHVVARDSMGFTYCVDLLATLSPRVRRK